MTTEIERSIGKAPSREEFRESLDRHREAGTCYLCGKVVLAGEARHGVTGAHWDCAKRDKEECDLAIAKGDAAFGSMGLKKRKREGEGKTALKVKAMAIEALQKALGGVELTEVSLWNQKGCYRGPRWDLDAWGVVFKFESGGNRMQGAASSLATMSDCAKHPKLMAKMEGAMYEFTLWPEGSKAQQSGRRE